MKKSKINILSIIFLSLAFVSIISWSVLYVLDIELMKIVISKAFLTVLFLPLTIVIYVVASIGVIGCTTYLGITIFILNIVKLVRSIKENNKYVLNIVNIVMGVLIVGITGLLYSLMGV